MKLIKFLLNCLLFVVVFAISMGASIGIYSAISYQSADDYALIHFASDETDVSYIDAPLYWTDNIKNGVSNINDANSKSRVANWFNWSWWKNSMSKVDQYFVNPIVAIVKPIILPITCADEIKTYYDRDISYFATDINKTATTAASFTTMASDYFHVNVNTVDGRVDIPDLRAKAAAFKLTNLLSDNAGTVDTKTQLPKSNNVSDVYDVAGQYNYFYQIMFKLNKYNRTDDAGNKLYEKWYKKFIFEDEAGRHLKSSVYSLYTIELVALVFSLFFVWQNPITIRKNENGEAEVKPSLRWSHKRKKNKEEAK